MLGTASASTVGSAMFFDALTFLYKHKLFLFYQKCPDVLLQPRSNYHMAAVEHVSLHRVYVLNDLLHDSSTGFAQVLHH